MRGKNIMSGHKAVAAKVNSGERKKYAPDAHRRSPFLPRHLLHLPVRTSPVAQQTVRPQLSELVSCRSSSCTVVKLRKNYKGEVLQDCDIYIGPRIDNPHWRLDASIWLNPFHIPGFQQKSLQMFRNHILSNSKLRDLLPSLRGKRLGCFCKDLTQCHGQELVKIVNETDVAAGFDISTQFIHGNQIMFFKGEKSPLSNLHKSPMKINDIVFTCLEQARAHHLATHIGEKFIAQKLANYDISTKELLTLSKNLVKSDNFKISNFTLNENIQLVHSLLKVKMAQDTKFRKLVQKHKTLIFVEATYNKFWGCGADIQNLLSNRETVLQMKLFPGLNILGWLITEIAQGKAFYTNINSEKKPLYYGQQRVIEALVSPASI